MEKEDEEDGDMLNSVGGDGGAQRKSNMHDHEEDFKWPNTVCGKWRMMTTCMKKM